MKLSIKDRLIIQNLFIHESDFMTILMQRDIRKKIDITQDEAKAVNMRNLETGGGVVWDEPKEGPLTKEIEFTEAELLHLGKLAREADQAKKVTEENLDTIQLLGGGK